MKKPEVTIAIPFFNAGRDLVESVQSVFAQTFHDWELILCNDGSDDASLDFARSLDDPRVRVLSDGRRRGLAPRLNETISAARGEYYFRHDADDVMHPERVAQQLAALRSAAPDVVSGSASYAINLQSETVGMRRVGKPGKGFAARHNLVHPTVAARTDWFRRNPYSENPVYFRCEDAELWCRISEHTEFLLLDTPLVFVREGDIFYWTKYVGTGFGVLHLARRHSRNKRHEAYLLTRELAKIWLTSVCDTFGAAELITNRRFGPIAPDAAAVADAVMRRIQTQALPVSFPTELYSEFQRSEEAACLA